MITTPLLWAGFGPSIRVSNVAVAATSDKGKVAVTHDQIHVEWKSMDPMVHPNTDGCVNAFSPYLYAAGTIGSSAETRLKCSLLSTRGVP